MHESAEDGADTEADSPDKQDSAGNCTTLSESEAEWRGGPLIKLALCHDDE